MKKILIVVMALMFTACAAKKTIVKETPPAATVQEQPADIRHVVKAGSCLWDISGDQYGDAFKWTLIYKANRDQIEDPDIIEIGQQLTIRSDHTQEETDKAVKEAQDWPPFIPRRYPK